jgi:hypothetical protein
VFLADALPEAIDARLDGFRYRFATGADVWELLPGAQAIIQQEGALYHAFMKGFRRADPTILPALDLVLPWAQRLGKPWPPHSPVPPRECLQTHKPVSAMDGIVTAAPGSQKRRG